MEGEGGQGEGKGRAGNFPTGPVSLPPGVRPWGTRPACPVLPLRVEHVGWAPRWLGRLCDRPHQHEVWMKRQEAPVPEARPRPGTRKCSRLKAPRRWGAGPVRPARG